jgi:hypothetical protein
MSLLAGLLALVPAMIAPRRDPAPVEVIIVDPLGQAVEAEAPPAREQELQGALDETRINLAAARSQHVSLSADFERLRTHRNELLTTVSAQAREIDSLRAVRADQQRFIRRQGEEVANLRRARDQAMALALAGDPMLHPQQPEMPGARVPPNGSALVGARADRIIMDDPHAPAPAPVPWGALPMYPPAPPNGPERLTATELNRRAQQLQQAQLAGAQQSNPQLQAQQLQYAARQFLSPAVMEFLGDPRQFPSMVGGLLEICDCTPRGGRAGAMRGMTPLAHDD